jgi:recombinational DNA repair protein (RecF pathway)
MSHTTYETRALIMHRAALREGDALVELFTEELGYLRAIASSARQEHSKMRYALEPYALAFVTLIRGRDSWRLRGARVEGSLYRSLSLREDQELMARVVLLVRRLMIGEEESAELFAELLAGVSALALGKLADGEKSVFEVLFVLRIISLLGYRPEDPTLLAFLPPLHAHGEDVKRFASCTKSATAFINTALRESGL